MSNWINDTTVNLEDIRSSRSPPEDVWISSVKTSLLIETMGYTLVAAVLCLAILRLSEGTVPVITETTTNVVSPLAKDLAENTAAAASVISLTSTQSATYVLGGADAASFTISPGASGTAGTIATVSIVASPVYATKSSYTMTVSATESASPNDPSLVFTVNVAVIKTPAFTATTFTVTPCDGATATTAVTSTGQLTATGHAGRTLVYAFASGNTAADLTISTTTGQITVATGKTLDKATTATYTLVVTAGDATAPVQTGTTTVTVNVGCGSAAITGSLAALLCMIFSIIQKLA